MSERNTRPQPRGFGGMRGHGMGPGMGMGVGENNDWFEKPSYLGCWVSEYPWGPWRQIYEAKEWLPRGDKQARAYQPQFMPAWLSADGKSFYMAWTEFRSHTELGSLYAYQHQRVDILTE